MNYIDIIIISVILFFVLKGILKGFARELMGILSFVISFVVALSQMKTAANFLDKYIENYWIALIVGYIAIFLITFIILHIIAGAIHKLLKISSLGWLNRLGGAVFGLFFSGMLISMAVFLVSFIPLEGEIPPGKKNSQLYPYFEKIAPGVYDFFSKVIPGSKSLYDNIQNEILSEQLLKSGIDIDDVKELLKDGSEEGKRRIKSLLDSVKGIENLKNIDIEKQKESLEKSKSEESLPKSPFN